VRLASSARGSEEIHQHAEIDSKWFLQALGHEGLNNLLNAYEDKSARAVCTFAYCKGPGQEPLLFEGRVNVSSFYDLFDCENDALQGKIVPARGPPDFGTSAFPYLSAK